MWGFRSRAILLANYIKHRLQLFISLQFQCLLSFPTNKPHSLDYPCPQSPESWLSDVSKEQANRIPRFDHKFSAAVYLNMHINEVTVLEYSDNVLIIIHQFECSPNPNWTPNFRNSFTWTHPFVERKVTKMLVNVLSFSVMHLRKILTLLPAKLRFAIWFALSVEWHVIIVLLEGSKTLLEPKSLPLTRMLPMGTLATGRETIKGSMSGT